MCAEAKHFYWMSRKVRVKRGEVRVRKKYGAGREGGVKEWRVGVSQDEPQEEGERRQTLIFSNQWLSEELEMLEATECLLSYKHWVKPAGRKKVVVREGKSGLPKWKELSKEEERIPLCSYLSSFSHSEKSLLHQTQLCTVTVDISHFDS